MINSETKFDFDDILIVPNVNTHITSRYKDIKLYNMLPIFTAPMDTVINKNNIDVFLDNKIYPILPRTIAYSDIRYIFSEKKHENVFVSLGFGDIEDHLKSNFKNFHKNAHILIDVANGHMQKIIDFAREIKRLRPDIIIMAGNIANSETYEWYAKNNCIDYVRCGIGNGGGCLTTKNSGIGYPMASLIYEVHKVKKRLNIENPNMKLPAIIADGGMKDYADIVKALALGADYVMLGSILNKSLESCADNYFHGIKINSKVANYLFDHGYIIKKYFRGMSTKQVQKAMGRTTYKTSEGVVRFRKVEYRLHGWRENFEHYLRNAMSYNHSRDLTEFIGNTKIILITKSAYERFNK